MSLTNHKHINAISGITFDPLSSQYKQDLLTSGFNQQDLLGIDSDTDTSLFSQEMGETSSMVNGNNPFTVKQGGQKEQDDDDFITKYIKALQNPEVRQLLTFSFNEAIDTKIEPVKKAVETIQVENKARDQRVDKIERKLDVYEQKDRENNILITGMAMEDLEDKTKIAQDLNNKLKIPKKNSIKGQDIKYALKSQTQGKPTKIKIAFHKKETKEVVMKNKINLQGQRDVWISDDLTPMRANLAFIARRAKHQGAITDTWTYDNKVFIRKLNATKSTKVITPEDIPGYKPN